MKKAEKAIIYTIAIVATIYSIWAHGKLQRIYRINRETLIPAYEKQQSLKKDNATFKSQLDLYDDPFQELYNKISMPWAAAHKIPYSITDGFVEDKVFFMVIRIEVLANKEDLLKVGDRGIRNLLLDLCQGSQFWFMSKYPRNRPCRLHIFLSIPGRSYSVASLNKLDLHSKKAPDIAFHTADYQTQKKFDEFLFSP